MDYRDIPRERRDIILASAKRAMQEIGEDVATGVVPVTEGFSQLHDFVDANTYGGWCDDFDFLSNEEVAFAQDRVDFRLRLIAKKAEQRGEPIYR